MDVSLCLDTRRPWPELRDLAVAADDRGLHAVYVADHFLPVADDGPVLECWTTLTAIAGVTSTVRVGTLVLGNTYRHPAVVANMAATLDHVSAGRRRTLRIAATYADVWHAWTPADDLPRKSAVLDRHCLAVGRDPSTIRRAAGRVLLGEPEPAAVLAEHEQAGLDEFVVRDHHEAGADEILATLPG